jgi:hypothetical protein
MLHVWDDDHIIKAWMSYISENRHDDMEWHYMVSTIILDKRASNVALLWDCFSEMNS